MLGHHHLGVEHAVRCLDETLMVEQGRRIVDQRVSSDRPVPPPRRTHQAGRHVGAGAEGAVGGGVGRLSGHQVPGRHEVGTVGTGQVADVIRVGNHIVDLHRLQATVGSLDADHHMQTLLVRAKRRSRS